MLKSRVIVLFWRDGVPEFYARGDLLEMHRTNVPIFGGDR